MATNEDLTKQGNLQRKNCNELKFEPTNQVVTNRATAVQ